MREKLADGVTVEIAYITIDEAAKEFDMELSAVELRQIKDDFIKNVKSTLRSSLDRALKYAKMKRELDSADNDFEKWCIVIKYTGG